MRSWDDITDLRKNLPMKRWENRQLLFSHEFSFPPNCADMVIVISRNRAIKFLKEKLEVIINSVDNAFIRILLEEYNPEEFSRLLNNEGSNNKIEFLQLDYPLSKSIKHAVADKRLADRADCCVVLSPHYDTDDIAYCSMLALFDCGASIAQKVYIVDNFNYLYEYKNLLNDTLLLGGKSVDCFASLTTEDIETLYSLARDVSGGVIVEIGRFLGGSSCIIAQAVRDSGSGTVFYSVDRILPEAVHETVKKNGLADYVKLLNLSSQDAYESWDAIGDGAGIDFLFIDGDHSYKGVTTDIGTWGSLVKPGGIIQLHDYCNPVSPGMEEVDVAIYNMLMNDRYKMLKSCFTSYVCKKV